MANNLHRILEGLLDGNATARLLRVLRIPAALCEENTERVSRAVLAQALNLYLFEDLLRRVPAASDYISDCLRNGTRVNHDHGAVRTVALVGMGALPAGEAALLRVLSPLGYIQNGVYPLDRLKMIGRSYAQADYPEEIAQFFISELYPERFTPEFQGAVARVTATSIDPLTPEIGALLVRVQGDGLTVPEAIVLLRGLVKVFGRQHGSPTLSDYELLLKESAEMAWIATEGNVFNHATDRVADVQALTDEQKRLHRPMKETVEVSGSGRVRQTAFRAAIVTREFIGPDGRMLERDVPGSFMEFIARDYLPHTDGTRKLDLSFDPSNAQAIFKMTAQQSIQNTTSS